MKFEGFGNRDISLAMLGMVDGNGHPYSWSAIFNGYDREAMASCPYPGIPEYLGREPAENLGVPGVKVTHIWTDKAEEARHVSRASLIPNIVARPEDVLGEVDAVIVATDIGHEHVDRCRPFVEAGIPVFVDKPLVDNAADLAVFRAWQAGGRPFLTSSCMAFAREYAPYRSSTAELGTIRYATVTTMKSWERYGIHALSAIYPILGPGFTAARHLGPPEEGLVHFEHACGAQVVVAAVQDMYGAFGKLLLCGTKASAFAEFRDTYFAFKAQLLEFVAFLRTGSSSTPFTHTEELMRMIVAGIQSRNAGGKRISLDTLAP